MAEQFPDNVLTALNEALSDGQRPLITQELADALTEAGAEIPDMVLIVTERWDTTEMIRFRE
jgi:hypothetical protein